MRSVYDAILNKIALDPIAASAVQTGVAIDTKGYNSCVFVIQNGAATGTPTSYTVDAKVTECATSGGTYADVSGAVITQITADSKVVTIRVEGLGTSRLRYFKVVVTPALAGGTSPKALIGSVCCLGRAYREPVGNVT
jgi:hypothetical protein